MAIQLHKSFAVHPGKWVKAELVEPAGVSVTALADHMKVTRQVLSNVLKGNAGVSAQMAILFERTFGVKADTLMRMQAAHDLAKAREDEKATKVGRLELPDLLSCRPFS